MPKRLTILATILISACGGREPTFVTDLGIEVFIPDEFCPETEENPYGHCPSYHPDMIDTAAQVMVDEFQWHDGALRGLHLWIWPTKEIMWANSTCSVDSGGCTDLHPDIKGDEVVHIYHSTYCIDVTAWVHELIHVWHNRKGYDVDFKHDRKADWQRVDRLRTMQWLYACGGVARLVGGF